MQFLQFWFTPVSILIAALSLFLGVYNFRKQANIQIFLEFTKRYESIMDSFPPNARFYRLNTDSEPPESSNELTIAVLKYLNLCAEEYYLRETGQLSKKIWNIWKDELEKSLQSKLIKREWKTLKNEFSSYRKFQVYVDQIINRKNK